MDEERRRYPRYALDAPAKVACEGAIFDGQLKDICHDAVLFEGAEACSLGATAHITTEILGGSGRVEITGRVIRTAVLGDGKIAVAVLFTGLTPAAATQIEFFIQLQA